MGCCASKPSSDGTNNNGDITKDAAGINQSDAAANAVTNSVTGSNNMSSNKLEKKVVEGGFTNQNFIIDNKGKVVDYYTLSNKRLGQGTYGSVSKATMKEPPHSVRAIKSISKASSQVKNLERFKQEIQIMKFVDHPNIVKLYETFEDVRNIYLVMELCNGGELFDRIIGAGHFTEVQCACIMRQMLRVIYYLHSQQIMHRDLKPENFLFVESNDKIEKSTLKLIDFGLSCKYEEGETKSTKAGTPYYVSPQVLAGKYDQGCDVWSCGVIMYIMLCGYPPFYGENDTDVLARVKLGTFTFVQSDWKDVSSDATELITKLLKKDPVQRYSAGQALDHIWIKQMAPKAQEISLAGNIIGHLKAFRSGNQLRKAALHVIATQLDEAAIKNLRTLFMQLDVNGDGQLTVQELTQGLEKAGIKEGLDSLKDLIKQIDSDGSGSIDYTEFLAATLDKRQYLKEDVCWGAFKVFDRNGDGKISKAELVDVLYNNKEMEGLFGKQCLEEIMNETDINGDGEIDFDEFMTLMKNDAGKKKLKEEMAKEKEMNGGGG